MSNTLVRVAELVAAIGAGLVGGVFFGFSTTVMKSLRAIPPTHGITAMQNINTKILNPRFAGVFMLTTAASTLLAVGRRSSALRNQRRCARHGHRGARRSPRCAHRAVRRTADRAGDRLPGQPRDHRC
jgi:hypothetical protein